MKKTFFKSAALLASVSLCSLALFSCGNKDKLTVGSIIFDSSNEWFVEALTGMRDAARDLNVTLNEADCHYDEAVEKDMVREQIKKKASALVVCPLSVEGTGAVLNEAGNLGIPVITWNSVVEPRPTAEIIVDSTQLGSGTGEYLREYVKKNNVKKLKAALLIDRSFSIGIERCDGFRNSIQPLIDDGILEIVYETPANLYEETKVTLRKILSERTDVNFIWCWHQMSTMAAVDVLKETGRSDILVSGTDMSLALAEDMLSDKVSLIAITTQQPYKMGYDAVSTAVGAITSVPEKKTFVIPVLTYTKEDPAALKEYISVHAKYVKK